MTLSPSGWRYRRSLASRVTLLTTIAVGLSIAAIAAGVYVVLRMQLQSSMDEDLNERAHSAASQVDEILDTYDNAVLPNWVLGAGDVRVAIIEPDQRVRILDLATGEFPRLGQPERDVLLGKRKSSIRTIHGGSDTYRVVTVPAADKALVLAQSMRSQNEMFTRLGFVMLLFGAAGVVAAGIAGWGVATGGLRPVRRLTADVERIADTEDLTPIPVEGDDEVASLATSFNRMLIALAASRDRQRQLVADASHELRTPLTSLRTNIDLLAQADASLAPDQRAELLDDVRAQMNELTTLIGDLVELAREDPPDPNIEPIDLADLVHRAVERVQLRAPGIEFTVDVAPWWVVGDSAAIERAVTNLLDNAAKWSPDDGTVHVGLMNGELTVDDEGPGIALEDRPHVFDRFYRSTESRGMPGSGLGLAIVRQTAERAGGAVEAGDSPHGGARLILTVPGAATPPPTGPPPE